VDLTRHAKDAAAGSDRGARRAVAVVELDRAVDRLEQRVTGGVLARTLLGAAEIDEQRAPQTGIGFGGGRGQLERPPVERGCLIIGPPRLGLARRRPQIIDRLVAILAPGALELVGQELQPGLQLWRVDPLDGLADAMVLDRTAEPRQTGVHQIAV